MQDLAEGLVAADVLLTGVADWVNDGSGLTEPQLRTEAEGYAAGTDWTNMYNFIWFLCATLGHVKGGKISFCRSDSRASELKWYGRYLNIRRNKKTQCFWAGFVWDGEGEDHYAMIVQDCNDGRTIEDLLPDWVKDHGEAPGRAIWQAGDGPIEAAESAEKILGAIKEMGGPRQLTLAK